MRDQELILRILALYCASTHYARPLKVFLNKFAGKNRDASAPGLRDGAELFKRASHILREGVGPDVMRKASRQVNAAQTEAIFVGLMRRLETGDVSPSDVAAAVEELRGNSAFDAATTRATADEEPVATRLRIATDTFARIA